MVTVDTYIKVSNTARDILEDFLPVVSCIAMKRANTLADNAVNLYATLHM